MASTPTSSRSRWTIAAWFRMKTTSTPSACPTPRCAKAATAYAPPSRTPATLSRPPSSPSISPPPISKKKVPVSTCPSPSASWAPMGPCARTTSAAFSWWASLVSTAACAPFPVCCPSPFWPARKASPTSSCPPPMLLRPRSSRASTSIPSPRFSMSWSC